MASASVAAPGAGWPGDPAAADTPVAGTPDDVRSLSLNAPSLAELTARQSVCRACPRLVAWREQVAVTRRRSYQDEHYWGRPIPGWGDPAPSILIVGLAPAAHGGNRTGRIFTGDRSGDFLFASLHRCGLAAQPTSVTAADGQRLLGTRMAAVVRCAPPDNKPTPTERDNCAPWLSAELSFVADGLRVIVCLGGFAWQALWRTLEGANYVLPRPRPAFAHGAEVELRRPGGSDGGHGGHGAHEGHGGHGSVLLLGCYHPSQQNTFTGRVTPEMLDVIFARARARASDPYPTD
jgi:uracil-DNA glycosylase family 4